MREQVLAGAGDVDYQPNDGGPWLTRLQAELQAGSGTIGVLGALTQVAVVLQPLNKLRQDVSGRWRRASGRFGARRWVWRFRLRWRPGRRSCRRPP